MRHVVDGEFANLVIVSGSRKPGPVWRYVVGQIHDTYDCSLLIVSKHVAAHRNNAAGLSESVEGSFDYRLLVAAFPKPSAPLLEPGLGTLKHRVTE